jgi:lipoprotein-releasing system permease protein
LYKLHLIKKYLLKRRIAWISLLAVMLCTAMVLVVISVMGGWLRMFKSSFRGISGDVIVQQRSLSGFPYYQEMIDKITALPDVEAAGPSIDTAGLINIEGYHDIVEISGIDIKQIGKIGDFPQTLYSQYEARKKDLLAQANKPGISEIDRQKLVDEAEHPTPSFDLRKDVNYSQIAKSWRRPGIIMSDAMLGLHRGQEPQDYTYEYKVTLTVVPIRPHEDVTAQNAVAIPFWIVDTSHPRIYQLEYNRVYVPFDVLQSNLEMNATDTDPARTSDIQIKAKPGVDLMQLRNTVDSIVMAVEAEHSVGFSNSAKVQTWQQGPQAKFIDAVEHEVVLTTMLFSIISVVAVFLIFCIFYMIVVEKTKDIGIIKSVGATGWGVAQIFLGYGLAIGVIGAGMGLLLAFLVVHNINWLHSELTQMMGVTIWDPETYQFQKIPDTMEWHTVGWIVLVAVLSALLGALVPALRAAGMNPVEALRYE